MPKHPYQVCGQIPKREGYLDLLKVETEQLLTSYCRSSSPYPPHVSVCCSSCTVGLVSAVEELQIFSALEVGQWIVLIIK